MTVDAYTCGIDNIMELGYSQNIIAQPTRLSFREMLEVDPTEISTIRNALKSYISDIKSIDFPVAIDAWQEEIINGVQMDIHRAQFTEYLLTAMLNHVKTMIWMLEFYRWRMNKQGNLDGHNAHID